MSNSPALSFALPEAVIVSGASSGLGDEICQMLLSCGVATIGVDIAGPTHSLEGANGYTHIVGDVSEENTWKSAIQALTAGGHRSIGLVTSAAMLDVATLLDVSKKDIERSMNVNVIGTALAMKAVLPLMIDAGKGAIVAVASIAASFAEQQLGVYAASKGAVRQLARTVAMDHARQGVRVNVLSPGPMMAGLFKRHLESAADSQRFFDTRSARQPNGRIPEAREVASAALFLLSEGAIALNGADVTADGGLTASFDFRTGAEGASI
ncbi:SDR family NAD(P)-dependent oxidoreductase [Pseudomonas kurunegalensis]|uniref:SDR family NAD(P)-dependent oxidoreductase n=1 Tax=Pseudomonas kurunegalensis TaxID=485880 RepID=UPI003558C5A9